MIFRMLTLNNAAKQVGMLGRHFRESVVMTGSVSRPIPTLKIRSSIDADQHATGDRRPGAEHQNRQNPPRRIVART